MDDKYYEVFDVEMSRVERMIVAVFAGLDIGYTAYRYPWLSEGNEAMIVFNVPEGAKVRQGRFSFFLQHQTLSHQGFYAVALFFGGPKLDGTEDRMHDLELISCGREAEAMLERLADTSYQGLGDTRK